MFAPSDSRKRSWATIREDIWSFTGPFTNTIPSFSNLEYRSKALSPPWERSRTMGTILKARACCCAVWAMLPRPPASSFFVSWLKFPRIVSRPSSPRAVVVVVAAPRTKRSDSIPEIFWMWKEEILLLILPRALAVSEGGELEPFWVIWF